MISRRCVKVPSYPEVRQGLSLPFGKLIAPAVFFLFLCCCGGPFPITPPVRQMFPRPLEEVWQAGLEMVKLVRYPLAGVEGSIQEGHVLIRTGWKVFPGYSTRHYSEDVWERFTIAMDGIQQETDVEIKVVREIRKRSTVAGFTIQEAPAEQRQRREQEILAGLAHFLGF